MYRLANLFKWKGRSFDLSDENDWLDLLDDFGPSLPRFLLDGSCATSIPDGDAALNELRQSLVKHPVSSLTPDVGSVWVLFVFDDRLDDLPPPFRRDGVLLPFEWRRDCESHSELLPEALLRLADRVKLQYGDEARDCTLHPSRHFLDAVDFRVCGEEFKFTFDSAWGALATGLHLLLSRKKELKAWPFSTIAYDFENGVPQAVGGLARKLLLAASAGAEEIAVAPVQYREARKALASLQAEHPKDKALGRLRIYHWRPSGDLRRSVAALARCNQPKYRKRILFCVASLFMFTLPCLMGYAYWLDWNWGRVSYFADYVERNGVVEGRFPISVEEMAKRGRSYRCHYQGYDSFLPWSRKRVLREMWCVNGRGAIRVDENDYPEHPSVTGFRFSYDARGRVSEVKRFLAGGLVGNVIRYVGDHAEMADVLKMEEGRVASGAMRFTSSAAREMIRRIEYLRNADGFVTNMVFRRDSSGMVAADGQGMSQISFELREDGRIVAQRYLDWCGKPVATANGVHLERFAYDGYRLTGIRYYGLDEKPVHGLGHEDERVYVYSPQGNLIQVEKKRDGRLVERISYERDAVGDVTKESYFWAEGVKHTKDWNSRAILFDDCGNVVRETFFDSEGRKWKRSDRRVATIEKKFSDVGELMEEACYDESGRLMLGAGDWAKRTFRREKSPAGFVVWRWYFGEDGKPCVLPFEGFAGEKKIFDTMGHIVEWELFDRAAKKVNGTGGWQRVVYEYGRDWKCSGMRFYDKSGKLIKEKADVRSRKEID